MENFGNNTSPRIPLGLQSLFEECNRVYPDQKNPMQVSTVLKYWLGGNDVLDYINLMDNKGDPDRNILPHWHYISFGLSDLHGDGRVHEPPSDLDFPSGLSGLGFELTFRLLKDNDKCKHPPTWPANLLQDLARYVFNTGNRFCVGDNIPWRKKSLDNSDSKILHMLIADDAQLKRTETPYGWVDFFQIVGVTSEELEQASRWNGHGVIKFLRNNPITGGEFLITDMKRSKSVFELFPETLLELQDDLEKEGSDLVGVNAEFTFRELGCSIKEEVKTNDYGDEPQMDMSREFLSLKAEENSPFSSAMSTGNSLSMSGPIHTKPIIGHAASLVGIELTLAPYAAKFLILAIKDRIRHGRHFTFKSQNLAVTFVAESVTGAMVNHKIPYALIGYWMQILIPDDLVPRMLHSFGRIDKNPENLTLPLEFEFLDKGIKIIIDNPRMTESKVFLP
ncbi:Suppressor of fused homolog [Sergentomyia squamirostris]